ncbi:MAG: hypothetical protein OXI63_20065 [Candidatus Poribacteria bacterium]|nr:hypothetical protein [Candidatus Poribacteria bacterium]
MLFSDFRVSVASVQPNLRDDMVFSHQRSETQLYTVRIPETSRYPKRWVSLGFRWLWCIRSESCFSLIFGFRWHPFNPTYGTIWFFLINVVKPNFTPSGSRKLHGIQSVGFLSVSGGCSVSGVSCVFL